MYICFFAKLIEKYLRLRNKNCKGIKYINRVPLNLFKYLDCIGSFRECFGSMISIRPYPFWMKNHRNHAVLGSELTIFNENFFINILCIQFGSKMILAHVGKQQKETCTSQSDVILNEIAFEFKCQKKIEKLWKMCLGKKEHPLKSGFQDTYFMKDLYLETCRYIS